MVIAGAGIGGLTAALALSRSGFRVIVLEQTERLEETGAGIQLSPNAARILIELGLRQRLGPHLVEPAALRIMEADSGAEIVRMPLGKTVVQRYGAPYWIVHRADLQSALAGAVSEQTDITVKLGMQVDDFVAHPNGVTVSARGRSVITDERGVALIAADGLWSSIRPRLGYREPLRFAGRTAWRALIPAGAVSGEFCAPTVQLWLGREAHVVHYPVRGGDLINIVVIAEEAWHRPGWSEPACGADLLKMLPPQRWAPPLLALVQTPVDWLKWALYDRRPLLHWSNGPVALLGDAAHPMLPFLAQGAAMAIEDAATVAQYLARMSDPVQALRAYSAMRRRRAWKVQRLAARNGARYHLGGARAMLRNTAMRALGGARLLRHYDWLYGWRLPTDFQATS